MGQKTAVIRREMDQTRESLTRKMEALERSLLDPAKAAIDTATQAVEGVAETAEHAAETVKEALDVPRQVRRHPWPMMGGAVVLGFLGGLLLHREVHRRRSGRRESHTGLPGNGHGRHVRSSREARQASPKTDAHDSWMGHLQHRFHDEIDQVKKLALGVTFGLARDWLMQSVPPPLHPPLTDLMDDITAKLGGEPVEGDLLQTSPAKPGYDQPPSTAHQRW